MAQIKKLQKGSLFPGNGTFTMGTKTLEGGIAEERILEAAKNQDPSERRFFSAAASAVRDGMDVVYDPIKYTMRVFDKDGNDVSGNYIHSRVYENDSTFKKEWDATFDNQRHRDRKSAVALANVNMDLEELKPTLPELEGGNNRWFVYEKDDKGNWVYAKDDPTNLALEAILRNAERYTTDEEFRNQYAKTGWTQPWLKAYENAIAANQWNGVLKNIRDRMVLKGKLDESDKNWLKILGIEEPTAGDGGRTGDGNGDDKKKERVPKGSGFDVSYLDDDDMSIVKGDDGYFYLVGGDEKYDKDWYLGGIGFAKGTKYENGFLLNRRFYTPEEAYNSTGAIQSRLAPWYTANMEPDYARRWNLLNNGNIQFFNKGLNLNEEGQPVVYYGTMRSYDTNTDYNPYWHNYFLKTPGVDYFQPVDVGNDDYRIIQIPTGYDPLTGFKSKYAYYNPATGEVDDIEGDFNKWLDDRGITLPKFARNLRPTISSFNDKGYAVAATINSDLTGENTILYGRDGKFYLARKNGEELTNPRLIDQNMALQIIYNPQVRAELAKLNNAELLKKLVNNQQNARQDMDEAAKRALELYNKVGFDKQGGHIPTWKDLNSTIKKYQYGGTTDTYRGGTDYIDTTKAKADLSKSHQIGGADGGLTNDEWLQVGAAAADLAGIALTFAPEVTTNVVGATLGFGATAAKQSAIRRRTGSTKGVVGDVLLDLASLIPVVGGFAKSAKAIKTIKAVAEPLAKVMGISGFVEAEEAIRKVAKTGKMTSDDATSIIQGLAATGVGAASMRRSLGESRLASKVSTKNTETDLTNYKVIKTAKVGDSSIEIKESKESIAKLINEKDGNSASVIKAIREKYNIPDGKTDDEITEALKKISGITKEKDKFRLANPFKKQSWKNISKNNREDVFKSENAPESKSVYYYIRHPFKRTKVLSETPTLGTAEELYNAAKTPWYKWKGNTERIALQEWSGYRPGAISTDGSFIIGDLTRQWWRPWQASVSRRPIITDPRFMLPMRTTRTPYLTPDVQIRYGRPEVVTPEVISAEPHIAGLLKAPYGTQFKLFKSGGSIPKFQRPYQPLGIGYDKTKDDKFFEDLYNPQGNYMKALGWLEAHPEERDALISSINAGDYNEGPKQMNGVKINNSNWYEQATNYKYGPVHNALMKWSENNRGTVEEWAKTNYTPRQASLSLNGNTSAPLATEGVSIEQPRTSRPRYTIDDKGNWYDSKIDPSVRGVLGEIARKHFPNDSENPESEYRIGSVNYPVSTNHSFGNFDMSNVPIMFRPKYNLSLKDAIGTGPYYNIPTGKFTTSLTGVSENPEDPATKEEGKKSWISKLWEKYFGDKGEAGGYNGNGYEQNRAAIIDAMRANWAASAINRDAAIWKDAYNIAGTRQFYGPRLEEKAYNFSDIIHGENMSKQPYLQQDFVTPDLREQMAFDLSKASAISGIEDKYNAARSQAKATTDAYNVDVRTKQSQIDADLANQKSTYQTELAYQRRLEDSKRLNELHAKVIDPYSAQLSKDYKTIDDQRRALGYESAVAEAERTRKNKIKSKIETSNLRKQYIADRDNPSSPWHNKSWEDWLVENGKYEEYEKLRDDADIQAGYLRELEKARSKYTSYPTFYRRRIVSSAEGGKIDKRSSTYDSIGRIAVNLSRESVKAIQKQKDNLAKRLLKLL